MKDVDITTLRNRQVLLARRSDGAVTPADSAVVNGEMPTRGDGQLLPRNIYLSIDPYLRGRMNDSKRAHVEPFALGEPMGQDAGRHHAGSH